MALDTQESAYKLTTDIVSKVIRLGYGNTKIIIAPSFVHLSEAREALGGISTIELGAQDVSFNESGAFTGETSVKQLRNLDVSYIIIGHSERRRGETPESSALINKKVKAVLKNSFSVILCLGEDLKEFEAGKTKQVIEDQIRNSLAGLTAEDMKNVVIAYEPVWAIGTGKTATPEQANDNQRYIRALLLDIFGFDTAAATRILYGGSVKPDNIKGLTIKPNIDGALVGGASLKAQDFADIGKIIADEKPNKEKPAADQPSLDEIFRPWAANEPQHKVAINGFGRIGKLALKAFLEQTDNNFEIVAVNDLDKIENLAHLFRYDSTFGNFKGEVKVEGDNLIINGRRIKVLSEKDPAKLPWKDLGVEVVIESTGRFTKRTDANKHIEAGANKVVISAPAEDEDITVVLGVNQEKYDSKTHQVISNASCTTNALGPVVKVLNEKFGIKSGSMVTVHAATNDQNVLDTMHKDQRRARATLGSMIPTTTGAAKAIGKVIPELRGKLDGIAIRVPTADVSAIHLDVVLKEGTTAKDVNAALKEASAEGPLSKYLGYTEDALVSSDFLRNPKSGTVDASLTKVIDNNMASVVIWYDNEWGYSNRLIEAVNYILGQTESLKAEAGKKSSATLPLIRNEFTVPEGQAKGFFTNIYYSYRLGELFNKPQVQIPDAVVSAIKDKLEQYRDEGKILSSTVMDFGGTDIDIDVTHRYGELNSAVSGLILETMKEGALKAQQLGLLKQEIDVNSMSLEELGRKLRTKANVHSITERGSEPVVIAKIIGGSIGAANIKLYHEFFVPGSTPLQKLGFVPAIDLSKGEKLPVRGFRAIVRWTEDVLKGNFNGPVWEFEKSAALKVITKDKKEILYSSKDEALELLALASQPNDYQITAIYSVEGSTLPSTEPLVTVVYQPVYGEEGKLRALNPTFIHRSQSGADAVGGIASMYYNVNFVPGGPEGEHYVATKPVTLQEARKAPKEGIAHVVVYGWQSKGGGIIPQEKDGVMDHVAINPPAFSYERKLADFLASVMTTHKDEQPYLTPVAAQERVKWIREEQNHLFKRAPKEADIDTIMNEVEAKVASGEYLSVTDDKADMGGKFGHNITPEYMLAIDRATVIEARKKRILSDGNIIGFTDKGRLERGTTVCIGDDSHILMLGDKSRNSAESHQLSFLAFTRGYLFAIVNGEKPYGLAQDYQGKEAKQAKENPYFYSHLNERFFEILREVMPEDYLTGVEKMYAGWKKWQETSATVTLPEPFSGNVSQQGIGSARYPVDVANGERAFGILAGDKMGPAALNRPIREGVKAALAAGEFNNGLVYEIWDAKAFDEHGNIPLDKLPQSYADVADAITQLKNVADQDLVKVSYNEEGLLKSDLALSHKEALAKLLKKAGYVPTERIYLDAKEDKEAIDLYLADSDRFNVKQVWEKSKPDWDINNPQECLFRPVLGSSVTKLGILAGGEYIGKDDPVMVGNMRLMKYIYEFLKKNPLIIQGDMNGSHWLAAIPTEFKYAVANKESHPILAGLVYTLSNDGKELASVKDIFGDKSYNKMRSKLFEFNYKFKQAQLGGQFEPYGTNWHTVEASYPLAKFLRSLNAENSPFLLKNKTPETRKTRPVGIEKEIVETSKTATATRATETEQTSAASKKTIATLGEAVEATKTTPVESAPVSIEKDLPYRAEVFKANLLQILAEHRDQVFFIGIETDIGEAQKAQIMPVYKVIDEIKERKDSSGEYLFPNLIVIRGTAQNLAATVQGLNKEGRLNLNNAFIGARKASVDNKIYDAIAGENGAWISAIDDSSASDYLPVFEAITLNMMAYVNADFAAIKNFYDAISDKPIDPGVLQDMLKKRIIFILPRATKLDTKQLRELYELAQQIYVAA
jgi:glyceraldehyde 3-phosphate dehydrogenase